MVSVTIRVSSFHGTLAKVWSLQKVYFTGTVRNLLTRKMTATSASPMASMPGMPTSSAKPVFGRAVEVGITVCVDTASWVNAAATVAVAGSAVGETVAVA